MIPVDTIKEEARKHGYGFNYYKHPLDEAPKVVLIGERHAVYQDYSFQGALINLVQPKVVMHEFYEPGAKPSTSELVKREKEWINRWKGEYGVELKPCDLLRRLLNKYHQTFYHMLRESQEFDDESHFESIIANDSALRERVMGKMIRREAKNAESPVVVIVGGHHVRPESKIHEELRAKRAIEIGCRNPFGYVTIIQDDIVRRTLQNGAHFFE